MAYGQLVQETLHDCIGRDGPPPPPVPAERRCWRCILLNRKCDWMPICNDCLRIGNDGLKILSCKRGEASRGLKDAFSGFTELSESTWLFTSGPATFKATVDHRTFGPRLTLVAVILLNPRPGPTPLPFYDTQFLGQFEMLSTRWPNTYDAMAERILTDAAFHTSYKLIHSAGGSEKQDSDEPVVLALKALVQARNIHVFTHHFPLNWFIDEHFRECPMTLLRAETFSGSQGQESMNPHVSLQRMSDGFEMPPEDQRMPEQQRLASFVERALESATKMLLRGDASEWIDVFWTLCILVLVHGDLERAAGFTDTLLTAQNELNRALENLTALYLHCCGDLHPLNDDEIDPEWVELVIGSHTGEPTKVWTQYVDYNSFWTGSRDDDWHVTSVKSFLKHLENYMNGWHLF